MAWVKPLFTPEKIKTAGNIISMPEPHLESDTLTIVNNWRAAHAFPLNTVFVTLNEKAIKIDPEALVWRRLKRYSSIRAKLQRQIRDLNLYDMQDIGGARAILKDCASVDRLLEVYNPSEMKRKRFYSEVLYINNYIENPKKDGYRSAHVIIGYKGKTNKTKAWDGLRIEIQLRTRMQHTWATTVETLESILEQRLRTVQGDTMWKRFLLLISAAIAIEENKPKVPKTPTTLLEIRREVIEIEKQLGANTTLKSYINAIRLIPSGQERGYFYLLSLRPTADETTILAFRRDDLKRAITEYSKQEQAIGGPTGKMAGANVVLVSGRSIQNLKEAYPNYFLDAGRFLELYDNLILEKDKSKTSAVMSEDNPGEHPD